MSLLYQSHLPPISQLRQFLFLGLWKHWWPLKEDSTESKNAYQHCLATHPIPWWYFYRRCDSMTSFWTTGQDHLEIIQKCVLSKFDFWHMIPYWVTVSKKKQKKTTTTTSCLRIRSLETYFGFEIFEIWLMFSNRATLAAILVNFSWHKRHTEKISRSVL